MHILNIVSCARVRTRKVGESVEKECICCDGEAYVFKRHHNNIWFQKP